MLITLQYGSRSFPVHHRGHDPDAWLIVLFRIVRNSHAKDQSKVLLAALPSPRRRPGRVVCHDPRDREPEAIACPARCRDIGGAGEHGRSGSVSRGEVITQTPDQPERRQPAGVPASDTGRLQCGDLRAAERRHEQHGTERGLLTHRRVAAGPRNHALRRTRR